MNKNETKVAVKKTPPVNDQKTSTTEVLQSVDNIQPDKPENQLRLVDNNNQPVTEQRSSPFMTVDFNGGEMPDLDECDVMPLDLTSNYWTPISLNESRRAWFVEIRTLEMQTLEDPEVLIELPCAFFYWKENGAMKGFCNASKVLVSNLKQAHVEKGTALEITWVGKKKNSSNAFKSDNWSIKPLMLKIAK